MIDLQSLIGLKEEKAESILRENGYNNIEVKINSKHNELCDGLLVTNVEQKNGQIRLICGEFYLDIKE